MIFSLVITIVFLVILFIFVSDRYNKALRLVRKIPGPVPYPLFGNSIHFILPLDKLFIYLRELYKKYGGIHQMHAVNARSIGISDPEHIEKILSSINFTDKQIPYNFMKPWLGEGLLTSQGTKWHQRRKLLTQAFHFNILKRYFITFVEQAEQFVEHLEECVSENQTNIVPLINSTTLRVMCETAMGVSTQRSLDSLANAYSKSISIVGASIIERMCRIWLYLDWTFKWSNIAKVQGKAIKDIHTFTNKIIKERRTYLEENNFNILEDDNYNATKGKLAMLDLLLEKEKSGAIDVNGIREEVDTFMFEGHDTTAIALTFLLMNIANETKVQEKIYEEMQKVFGDSDRMPTTEDLNDLKYLECCIKESLRLYPSVPIIIRYIAEKIKLGDYLIPENSHIHIGIYDLHRRPDIYREPENFIPERFLPENNSKRHPYAFIPFSAGPRNCIGQKFAMLEMKTLITALLRRYRLEAVTKPSDIVFTADIILRTKNQPIFVRFSKRN